MEAIKKIRKQLKQSQKLIDSLQMQVEFNKEDIQSLRDEIRPSRRMSRHEKLSLAIGAIVNLIICIASVKYLFF